MVMPRTARFPPSLCSNRPRISAAAWLVKVTACLLYTSRKTYANMIKYIKMTASSNFGNMFSVLAASALLPFLPMMSVHLIFLNLIYDLSCTAIPWDNVDEEFIAKPRKWDASSVGSFMIWIGPTSSIFDFTTYIFMYFVFCPIFVSGGVLRFV